MNVHSPKLPTSQHESLPEQRNIRLLMMNSHGAGTFSPASRARRDRRRCAARRRAEDQARAGAAEIPPAARRWIPQDRPPPLPGAPPPMARSAAAHVPERRRPCPENRRAAMPGQPAAAMLRKSALSFLRFTYSFTYRKICIRKNIEKCKIDKAQRKAVLFLPVMFC